MNAPAEICEFLREQMDTHTAKVIAARVDVDRTTLYNVIREKKASEQTLRKLGRAYPALCSTTSTNSFHQRSITMNRYKKFLGHTPAILDENIGMLGIEGDGTDDNAGGGGNPAPFSVSKEDWDATQAELQQSRADREEFTRLKGEHSQMREKFKPFLEGGSNEQTEREPDANDQSKYPRTQAGAAAYLKDFTDFRFKQLHGAQSKTAEAAAREQREAAQDNDRTNNLVVEHTKRVAEVAKSVPDFDQVVAKGIINIQQHKPLAMAILKLKNSAMVEYHLAKNPQEALQLIRTAASDLDDAKEVLFGLNHRFSEDAKKSAARRQAERAGSYSPTENTGGEMQASGEDAADEEFVRRSFGLKPKN